MYKGFDRFLSESAMSAKKPNELIDRYEEMLRGTVSCYFDTDEIDEISGLL